MRASFGFSRAGRSALRSTGTRYGIRMAGLDRRYREELDGYYLGGWSHAEIMGAFCLVDDRLAEDRNVVMEPRSGEVVSMPEALEVMRCIDWNCASCGKSVLATMGDVSRDNMLCGVCVKRGRGDIVREEALVQASVRFTDACKAHIQERTKYILRAMHGNAKRRKQHATPR